MKFFKFTFLLLLIILILLVSFQFIINPKYSFPEPKVFNGTKLYNPYLGMDSTKWKRANFHLHTKIDFGLTDGRTNLNHNVDTFYRFFNYDIHNTSDYMHINTFNSNNKFYVPTYEHGYQYYKVHQLVLNAKGIKWIDFVFRQTLDNKQLVINRLRKDTATLVAIAHPAYRKGYDVSDFKYLGNYNCLEFANDERTFPQYYDSALSSGMPVFLMADDDAHNMKDIYEAAHAFNVINTDLKRESIVHALKIGKSYGVVLNILPKETNLEKKLAMQKLPVMIGFEVKHDSIIVRFNKRVSTFKFIGQDGVLKDKVENCSTGKYHFNQEDTYIRTEVLCDDGTAYYLNPVFRYDGLHLPYYNPKVNILKTWTYRSVFGIISFLIIFAFIKFKLCTTVKK